MKKVKIDIILLTGILLIMAWGKTIGKIELPATVKGQMVNDFFSTFNADDESALLNFLQNNLRADTNGTLTIEQRSARMLSFKKIVGGIILQNVLSSAENKIRVFAKDNQASHYEIMFTFHEDEAGKIRSISIIHADPDDLDELSGPLLSEKQLISKTKEYLKDAAEKEIFSGVVLIARDDQILFQEAHGLASREYGVQNRIDTRFNLGSINKIFTRIAIGQLCEKGMLSLDDTLGKFLPDYPNKEAASKVTIGQLLDMTSGVGDFFTDKYFQTPKDNIRNLEDYLPLFIEDSLLFEPGTGRAYSNGGYLLLGLIVAKASGRDYFDYVEENI